MFVYIFSILSDFCNFLFRSLHLKRRHLFTRSKTFLDLQRLVQLVMFLLLSCLNKKQLLKLNVENSSVNSNALLLHLLRKGFVLRVLKFVVLWLYTECASSYTLWESALSWFGGNGCGLSGSVIRGRVGGPTRKPHPPPPPKHTLYSQCNRMQVYVCKTHKRSSKPLNKSETCMEVKKVNTKW